MIAGYHVPNLSYWQALGSITPLSLSWLSFLAALRSARTQSSRRRNCNGFTTDSSTNRVPAGVTRRNDQLPGRCLPTPATLCELVLSDKPAPRRRDYATTSYDKSRVSNCSRMLFRLVTRVLAERRANRHKSIHSHANVRATRTRLHPLCIDTAFSQRLLSRRFFRVAQIRKEHHRQLTNTVCDNIPPTNRIESRDYSIATRFHTTEVTYDDWYTNPAATIGLLREASVALQGLLISLTDLSNMRERDRLVLQHKQPHSALGQAHLQASGATESHRCGEAIPTPFPLGWQPNVPG